MFKRCNRTGRTCGVGQMAKVWGLSVECGANQRRNKQVGLTEGSERQTGALVGVQKVSLAFSRKNGSRTSVVTALAPLLRPGRCGKRDGQFCKTFKVEKR